MFSSHGGLILVADGAEAVGEHDVGIGLLFIECAADALDDHLAGIVVDGGQKQRVLRGGELGDDVALAQVGTCLLYTSFPVVAPVMPDAETVPVAR